MTLEVGVAEIWARKWWEEAKQSSSLSQFVPKRAPLSRWQMLRNRIFWHQARLKRAWKVLKGEDEEYW